MPSKHQYKFSPFSILHSPFILIALIFLFLLFLLSSRKPPTTNYQLPTINPQLLANLPVPEVRSVLKDKNISIPLAAVESTPGAKTKFRQFTIQAYKSAFKPNIILVYAGDIVRINLIANDNIYDFSIPAYNISQTAQKGETKGVEFQVVINVRISSAIMIWI